jgi:guanylate kinase
MSTDLETKNIFIISGPSGAGEDSIIDGLGEILPVERVITTTTRAPRPGEHAGNPYYFLSKQDFETKVAAGEFVEYAEEYNKQLYGVTRTELARISESGKIGLWKIEYQGVMTAKKLFPGIIAILVTAPLGVMEDRIRRRGNFSEEAIAERMAYTKVWLTQHANIYDYTVENHEGKLRETISAFKNIIEQERQR